MTDFDAAAALSSVEGSRKALADRMVSPPWYHPVLGVALGSWLASVATHRWLVILAVEAAYLLVTVALISAYRRSTGTWVSGMRRGSTRRASLTMLAALVAVGGIAAALDLGLGWWWVWLIAGVCAVPIVTVCGYWWDRLLGAELREAP